MKLLKQMVPAEAVARMIDARLSVVHMSYLYAKGADRKIEAEAMAEVKWQLAELKMQFLELLTDQVQDLLTENQTLKASSQN